MKIKIYKENETSFFPIYFGTSNINFLQQKITRPNGFELEQIFLVSSGTGILKIRNTIYKLEKNDLFYISKNTPYEHYGTSDDFSSTYLTFFGNGVTSIKKFYGIEEYGIYKNKSRDRFSVSAEKLFNTFENLELAELCASTYSAVITFFEEACKKEPSPIEIAHNFIHANYLKQITLDDILLVYPYSKAKLCRDFKEKYNMTIFEMILRLRLQYAKQLLTSTPHLSLKTLISLCGFNDVSYFCKIYKRFYKISPIKDIR